MDFLPGWVAHLAWGARRGPRTELSRVRAGPGSVNCLAAAEAAARFPAGPSHTQACLATVESQILGDPLPTVQPAASSGQGAHYLAGRDQIKQAFLIPRGRSRALARDSNHLRSTAAGPGPGVPCRSAVGLAEAQILETLAAASRVCRHGCEDFMIMEVVLIV